ncbi:MAG: nicotinate-nicotinamide nucleotide adenylyltransferase [Brevinematales bacterium]|nr:nicotinate-nicotinamide nucleotide adenylyltransferase [Brevinematales bacterium]
MKNIGIFGSAFHPPHQGHSTLVKTAQSFLHLDEILFVPTKIPPHKTLVELWGYEIRVLLACVAFSLESPQEIQKRMLSLPAFHGKDLSRFLSLYKEQYHPVKGWKLWEAEKEREGPSYTIDTLREYHSLFPDHKVFLLIGQDQASVFHTWKEYQRIFDLATVCVATRPYSSSLPPLPFVHLPPFEENISSSTLREAWLRGNSLQGLVPPPVETLLEMLR